MTQNSSLALSRGSFSFHYHLTETRRHEVQFSNNLYIPEVRTVLIPISRSVAWEHAGLVPTGNSSPVKMATFRRFRPDDVNKFSKCNLDPLTETYELNFYLQYHAKWPSLFQVCEDIDGNIVGYSGTALGRLRSLA